MMERSHPYRRTAQVLMGCGREDDPERVVSAAVEFLEEVGPLLANMVGPVGLRAMEGRALRMARTRHPVLERVQVGEGDDGIVEGLRGLAREAEPETLAPAATDLVGHLVALLASLLGEPIALRMLRRARPDLELDTNMSEGPGDSE